MFSIQGSHFSGDTKFHVFSRIFPGKNNEIQGQFGFESVFGLIIIIISLLAVVITTHLKIKIQTNN